MHSFGKYLIFLRLLVIKRERFSIFFKSFIDECQLVGINSIFIIAIVSIFIGAVTCIQTAHNLVSALIPKSTIGMVVRDMTILELAPTIMCVILAGKVGSNIAGQLGTMRITEQIDALEVMGINSVSFLVLPKIIACMFTFPMLVVFAGFLSILGGYFAGTLSGVMTSQEYQDGIRISFIEFNVIFALIKAFTFSFLIASISAYKGYYTKGGALELGKSSTQAVTNSCIAVLCADYLLAQLIL